MRKNKATSGPMRSILIVLFTSVILMMISLALPESRMDENERFVASPPATISPMACNGAPELCKRRYDQVVYATTHNAHSLWGSFIAPNQLRDIPEQLNRGIRGMMLDVYFDSGELRLCHDRCWTGYISLKDTLGDIKNFLDSNRFEVLTLIFESYVEPAQMAEEFRKANLLPYVYAFDGRAWPTLGDMITSGKRLVVFTSNLEDSQIGGNGAHKDYPWYHSEWRLAFENPYSYPTRFHLGEGRKDYCKVDRGNGDGLFVLNHFVSVPAGSYVEAHYVNQRERLLAGARYCQCVERKKLPNFVTVDFFNMDSKTEYVIVPPYGHDKVPDLVEVVNELNRSIICPSDITVPKNLNRCGATVSYPAPTRGPCDIANCSPAPDSFFPVGTTTVTCNTSAAASCSFTVTVTDNQQPSITCPADVVGQTTPGGSSAIVNYKTPIATDDCPVTVSCNPPSGSSFAVGVTAVTCTATDASGNTSACTFRVHVFNFVVRDDRTGSYVRIAYTGGGTASYQVFDCRKGVSFSGTAVVQRSTSCKIEFSDKGPDPKRPDRDVLVSANTCTLAGTAQMRKPDIALNLSLNDGDISNNSINCP